MKKGQESNFFGREDLLQQLSDLCAKRVASLVTCRGRRRVGKSTLIEVFARRNGFKFIKIEGKRPEKGMSEADELATFTRQLALQVGIEMSNPTDWLEAFTLLDRQLGMRERIVVLLDEISWLAYFSSGFASDLKIAWDNLFKKHDKLLLVLCGSVSSWLKENIVDNSAFLGRRSLDIVVPELPLNECVKFWGKRVSRIDLREIIDVLSITGGIPRYLEEINPSLSAEENIRRLCFRPQSVLRTDFDEMFRDVITEQSSFTTKVLRQLLDGPKTATEIAVSLKIGKGGRVSSALVRLFEGGFVSEDIGLNPETHEKFREKRFRLRDNYSRFYLKYIEPVKDIIDKGAFEFSVLDEFVDMDVVMGLAFENLVVNNFRLLVKYLHLGGAAIISAAPYYRRSTNGVRGRLGCQIDLLIQTRRSLYIVEVKRKKEIGRDVITEVDKKVSSIKRPENVSVRTALVYDGQLSPVVRADGYFEALVSSRDLIGL